MDSTNDRESVNDSSACLETPVKNAAALRGVLLVDDESFIRRKLRKILEISDFLVVGEATNGIEAVNMARALSPAVIIMDFMMDEMDGITAARKIHAERPETRIIMLTQMGMPHLVGESFRAGVSNFILKPFDAKRVLGAVRKAIGA